MIRFRTIILLLMLCVLIAPSSSISASSLNESAAVDIVIAFLNKHYNVTRDLYDHSRYHKCELNYYGNMGLTCDADDDQLGMIEFELDPKTGSVISWSYLDKIHDIHYVNAVPESGFLTREEAVEIAVEWINSQTEGKPDSSYGKEVVYFIGPSQNTAVQISEWRIEFWGDEHEYRVDLDAKSGVVTYYRCDTFVVSADRMTRSPNPVDTVETVFPEKTRIYRCEVLHHGSIAGTTDAYEIHVSDSNDSIFVVPLLGFVKAIGGQILDIDSSTPCFEFNQTIYAFDMKHDDLMPARRFTDYGLLGAAQNTPRLYCRLYDDLYIDTILLQSFAMNSLHIDVALRIVAY